MRSLTYLYRVTAEIDPTITRLHRSIRQILLSNRVGKWALKVHLVRFSDQQSTFIQNRTHFDLTLGLAPGIREKRFLVFLDVIYQFNFIVLPWVPNCLYGYSIGFLASRMVTVFVFLINLMFVINCPESLICHPYRLLASCTSSFQWYEVPFQVTQYTGKREPIVLNWRCAENLLPICTLQLLLDPLVNLMHDLSSIKKTWK